MHIVNSSPTDSKLSTIIILILKGLLATINMAKMLLTIFGLLILHQDVVEATYTMNETCAYYTGYIANPTNCQGWGACEDGVLKATGNCSDGYLYDSKKGICNYASKVTCGTSAQNICENSDDNTLVAQPSDCTQYCYCKNKTIMGCTKCPNNQLYNPSLGTCVNTYTCPADSICRLIPNNEFAGSETCGNYLRCLDGSGTESACKTGYFNALTGKCQTTNPCSTVSTSTLAPDTTICSKYTLTSGPQYFADDSTCYGYYTCDSTTGTGIWRSCPYTFNFDSTTSTCVQANQVKCLKNRCANINLTFVTDPSSSCEKYYYCSDGQQSTTSTSCPTNAPYFDEVLQACVPTAPSYPICT
ncbi:peritrophin-44-like [Bactrocera tryoni]|nr:peritrophin-44-like [Bactrocera tryoni]